MNRQLIQYKLVFVLVTVILIPFVCKPTQVFAQSTTSYTCFPTCSETDARFLAIAGVGLNTLSGDTITIQFSTSGLESSLEIGIFDGDTDGTWDEGATIPLEYTLYADPDGNASGTTIIGQWLGDWMSDNAWYTISLPNISEALSESGHYFYYMTVRLTDPTLQTLSAFKLRVNGTIELTPNPFSIISSLTSFDDITIVYPIYPDLSVTTYDGSWSVFFKVLSNVSQLIVWDGDMDYGSWDSVDQDTDDLDTPNDSLPLWTAGTAAVPESAVGMGIPPDDSSEFIYKRSPSVVYDVISPNGETYHNQNPSGNLEWERFSVNTAPYNSSTMDYHAEVIPAGIWQLQLSGQDLHNLNSWYLPGSVLGVDENGNPGVLLEPYLVGDTVWLDSNENGTQDPGEPGIAGVSVDLIGSDDLVLASAITDADGYFIFEVDNGTYTIQVTSVNFEPGGVLEGYTSTTGADAISDTVNDSSVLTYDFGYSPSGSISDQVWLESDGDGFFEPANGESGIEGVIIDLHSDSDGDGFLDLIGSAWTDVNGQYIFDGLVSGVYTVRIADSNFESGGALQGLVPSADQSNSTVDGANRQSPWVVDLIAGETYILADFGFHPLNPGGFGCKSGYWKQKKHYDSWVFYTPDDMYDDVFGVPYFKTLIKALRTGGGGEYALGRQAVAALLNATALGSDYLYTEYEVISMVQDAYLTGNFESTKNLLEAQNEMGCPLD